MKALTIWQPYAEQIAAGAKTVENRHWNTTHRGPLLIHAGRNEYRGDPELPRGVIVALVELASVHRVSDAACRCREQETGAEFYAGVWHLLLRSPRRIGPARARGMPGMWTADIDLLTVLGLTGPGHV